MSTSPEYPHNEFWMLECHAPSSGYYTDILRYPRIKGILSWKLGSRFAVSVPEPIRLEWDPDTEGPLKSVYPEVIPLYRRDLVDAIREAGVDNLDCYRTEIRHPVTDVITTDYFAVNIIGFVSAANLSMSKYVDLSGNELGDIDFDSLAIDPKRVRGLLMFRLAESASGVVIHRSVKERLESRGGFGLIFISPSEWVS